MIKNFVALALLTASLSAAFALEKLTIEGTPKTPTINFSPDGNLEIRGRSIPENSVDFYAPAIKWLDEYIKVPAHRTRLTISLSAAPKDSPRSILNIIRRVSSIESSGLGEVLIVWEFSNEEILRIGISLASEASTDMQFIYSGPRQTTSQDGSRVVVLGGCPQDGTAALVSAALSAAEKERGITINTSHVEYRSVSCSERAEFADDTFNQLPYLAAVLVGDGLDPREMLETARLAHVLSVQNAVVLFTRPADPALLEELTKGLAAVGYPAAHIFAMDLSSGIVCPTDPAISSICDYLGGLPPVTWDKAAPFLLPVADVSTFDASTSANGQIEAGTVHIGDPVEIVGLQETKLKSTITGIEMFRKILDTGEAGDNVGLLLRGIDKKDIRRGMVIAKPGSITPHSSFRSEVYLLKKEEGGRHTPFQNKYRPQFYFRTAEVTGEIEILSGRGADVATGRLIVPVAMDKGLRFVIREGGRTVGAGQVTEIIK